MNLANFRNSWHHGEFSHLAHTYTGDHLLPTIKLNGQLVARVGPYFLPFWVIFLWLPIKRSFSKRDRLSARPKVSVTVLLVNRNAILFFQLTV